MILDHKMLWEHHLKLASTYFMLAMKYMYINPHIHHQYYLKHLEHAAEMEKHFLAMQTR
jgi:hypothetical protein